MIDPPPHLPLQMLSTAHQQRTFSSNMRMWRWRWPTRQSRPRRRPGQTACACAPPVAPPMQQLPLSLRRLLNLLWPLLLWLRQRPGDCRRQLRPNASLHAPGRSRLDHPPYQARSGPALPNASLWRVAQQANLCKVDRLEKIQLLRTVVILFLLAPRHGVALMALPQQLPWLVVSVPDQLLQAVECLYAPQLKTSPPPLQVAQPVALQHWSVSSVLQLWCVALVPLRLL